VFLVLLLATAEIMHQDSR